MRNRIFFQLELLPVFNRTSSKQYSATLPTADWTDPHSTMNRLYHPQFHSVGYKDYAEQLQQKQREQQGGTAPEKE